MKSYTKYKRESAKVHKVEKTWTIIWIFISILILWNKLMLHLEIMWSYFCNIHNHKPQSLICQFKSLQFLSKWITWIFIKHLFCFHPTGKPIVLAHRHLTARQWSKCCWSQKTGVNSNWFHHRYSHLPVTNER